MGRTSKRIGVTWHEATGQYRKFIGKQKGRKGDLRPRCFYLGSDKKAAISRAIELTTEWRRLKESGQTAWRTDRSPTALPSPGSPPTREVVVGDLTLADAIKLYIAEQDALVEAKRVSDRHAEACRHRLARTLDFLGPNRRLAQIGQNELMSLTNHFASRPPAKKTHGQQIDPPRPISIASAVALIKAAKFFFDWLADHDVIEWPKPKRFRRIFAVDRDKMLTEEEQERRHCEVVSGDVQLFEIDQLGRLYLAADGRMRAWMLLALNCGLTQRDLSELRDFEVHLDETMPYIHRKRSKTGVEARWELWPETIEAIRRERAPANSLKRIFLTDVGTVLQAGGHSGRDAVRQAWRLLREKFKGQLLPFKFLRKTGADEMKVIGGFEISEMYLAHQELGLNKNYANRNWKSMWEALREFRRRLVFLDPGWMPVDQPTLFTLGEPAPTEVKQRPVKPTKRNRLGLANVSYHAKKRKYYARVYRDGKTLTSPYFDSPEKAADAAQALRGQIGRSKAA